MIRPGSIDDAPRAAPMRQRAWPDMIVTEEGMRHTLECVPDRAELALFAYEDAGRIDGWATAGRAWWHHDPGQGMVTIAVDPERRGRRIASALAEAADAHLAALGIRTTRTESLDEPAARALAGKWGFTEIGASSTSAVDPRTVEPTPGAGRRRDRALRRADRSRAGLPARHRDLRRHPERDLRGDPARRVGARVLARPDDRRRREPDGHRRRQRSSLRR